MSNDALLQSLKTLSQELQSKQLGGPLQKDELIEIVQQLQRERRDAHIKKYLILLGDKSINELANGSSK